MVFIAVEEGQAMGLRGKLAAVSIGVALSLWPLDFLVDLGAAF
jgi:hypothetical protein